MESLSTRETLADLPLGASAVVTDITTEPTMTMRLAQFGLIPDTQIECVLRSGNGASAAFSVRGVVIALREQDCKNIHIRQDIRHRTEYTMLLVGNPNVGKSTVFNALTGLRQHTGNWCGKTVEGAKGTFFHGGQTVTLLDTPGTYALQTDIAEERAAADAVAEIPHDCVICVCDATALERGLILVLELLSMHRRVVLCVNLMDEATARGIHVDIEKLSQQLGIPVVGVTARKKKTLAPLVDAAMSVCESPQNHDAAPVFTYPAAVEHILAPLADAIDKVLPAQAILSPRFLALQLLICENPQNNVFFKEYQVIRQAYDAARAAMESAQITQQELAKVCHAAAILKAASVAQNTVNCPADAATRDRKIDRIVTSRAFGIPLMCLLLILVFWLTIQAANVPSAWLSSFFSLICSQTALLLEKLHTPWWLKGAIVDGIFRGTGWVISVMLPPMAIFFPLFTLLEDAGLLPRIAFCADHCFAGCRACGKQSLTMAMGFGCNAVGVTECRIIDSKRERLIAILTNSFVPCNGRFPPRPGYIQKG